MTRRVGLARWLLAAVIVTLPFSHGPVSAAVMSFGPGTLIIPMDNGNPAAADDGQDGGMLRAYGLVYALLRAGVPVHWYINAAKPANGNDFTIPSAGFFVQDVRTGAAVVLPRPYRGGPFLIAEADADAALIHVRGIDTADDHRPRSRSTGRDRHLSPELIARERRPATRALAAGAA